MSSDSETESQTPLKAVSFSRWTKYSRLRVQLISFKKTSQLLLTLNNSIGLIFHEPSTKLDYSNSKSRKRWKKVTMSSRSVSASDIVFRQASALRQGARGRLEVSINPMKSQ